MSVSWSECEEMDVWGDSCGIIASEIALNDAILVELGTHYEEWKIFYFEIEEDIQRDLSVVVWSENEFATVCGSYKYGSPLMECISGSPISWTISPANIGKHYVTLSSSGSTFASLIVQEIGKYK